jgi:hypothetical protein
MSKGIYSRKSKPSKHRQIKPRTDLINHPPHYTKGKIETILVIEDVIQFWPAHEAYSVGNVIRYISRAVHKGNKQADLEKAQFYLDRLVGHPGKVA